jgi:hypothetical protein
VSGALCDLVNQRFLGDGFHRGCLSWSSALPSLRARR